MVYTYVYVRVAGCVLRVACCTLHVDSERACESASISIFISLSSTGTSASLYCTPFSLNRQSDSGVRQGRGSFGFCYLPWVVAFD
jgi:hypothetical protein